MTQLSRSIPLRARSGAASARPLCHRLVDLRQVSASAFVRGLKLALLLVAGLTLGMTSAVWAEPDPTPAADPPARVGRVSLLQGRVETSSAPGAAWEPARVNQPVTTQTAFWAPPGSQAELRVGSGSVRLDGNSQAVFSQLDDHGIAIDLAQGTVRARVRNLPTGDAFSLSADGVRAEALQPGDYRISHDPDRRATTVRALSGRMRVVTPSNSVNLEAGQESLIEAGGASLQLRPLSGRDDFDRWAEARDREQDRLAALRHVSPEMTGVESLDEHGVWEPDSSYGTVWYPRTLPPGWAPYRYGRWAWVSPWGWTWIDDSPWGFAPFHYGRWVLIGPRWAWVPGPLTHRPVWAPALVGYVGGHSGSVGWSIGIGAPVGWFPLAPYEVYRPPYRHSVTYINQINIIQAPPPPAPAPAPRPPGRPWRGSEGVGGGGLLSAPGPSGGPAGAVGVPPRAAGADAQPLNPAASPLAGTNTAPAYRYAQRPEALTVVSEDSFRHARPVGREHVPLTERQAAALQPLVPAAPAPSAPVVAPVTSPAFQGMAAPAVPTAGAPAGRNEAEPGRSMAGPGPALVARPQVPHSPLPPSVALPSRPEGPAQAQRTVPQGPPSMNIMPGPAAPAVPSAPVRETQAVAPARPDPARLEPEPGIRPRPWPGAAVAAVPPATAPVPVTPAVASPVTRSVAPPVAPVAPPVAAPPVATPPAAAPASIRTWPGGMAPGSSQGPTSGVGRSPGRGVEADDERGSARSGKPERRGDPRKDGPGRPNGRGEPLLER